MHTFGRKKCLIFEPFFKKLLQKVQSIGCLDLHFCAQLMYFSAQKFVWSISCWIFIRASLCTLLARKKFFIWPFFEKLLSKSTVYRLSRFHFWAELMYFSARNFLYFSCRIFIRASIVHTFGRKKTCFGFGQFFRKVASKSTVYRLSRLHFEPKNDFFGPTKFFLFFLSNFYQSIIVHTFDRKKVSSFGLFSKSCSQKVQSIGCLDLHFWAQK